MNIKVKSAIICDLVRVEDTGKHIIIGIYTGDILFQKLPVVFLCTLWMELFSTPANSDVTLEVKLKVPGNETPMTTIHPIKTEGNERFTIILVTPPIEIKTTGLLKFFVRLQGGRWAEAISRNVQLRGSTLPAP